MTEKRWLYFALGVTIVISIGAVTNQLVPLAPASGLGLSDAGITFPDGTEQTTAAAGASMRRFYQTNATSNGDQADGDGVCADGFHFASIWEVLEVSNLRYDKTLGSFTADAGGGPLVSWWGWIRTGGGYDTSTTVGSANCGSSQPWDSASSNHQGTIIQLPQAQVIPWTAAPTRISPWKAEVASCNTLFAVWCVEDDSGAGG